MPVRNAKGEHIAYLSKLRFSTKELNHSTIGLSIITGCFNQLKDVEIDSVSLCEPFQNGQEGLV